MSTLGIVALVLGLVAAGEGVALVVQSRSHSEATEAAALALGECQAQETPSAVRAAGDVVAASQADDLAALALQGDVVDAVPLDTLTAAVVAIGDKRTTVAAWTAANCTVLVAAGADSAVCGGTSLAQELRDAGQALAVKCPECDCPSPAQ